MQECDSDSDNSITMDDIEDCSCLLKIRDCSFE